MSVSRKKKLCLIACSPIQLLKACKEVNHKIMRINKLAFIYNNELE